MNNTQEMLLLIKDLSGKMEKVMDHKRYQHTLSVAATASCMAMRFQTDPYQAYLAGLMHDNAKCISNEKKLSICVKNKLSVNPAEEKNPDLLHAKVGSFLAKEKFKIDDEQILCYCRYVTHCRNPLYIINLEGKSTKNIREKL